MQTIINTSLFFPWRLIYCFVFSFVFYNISTALTKPKINSLLTFAAVFVSRVAVSLVFNSFPNYNAVGYLISAVLWFIVLQVLTISKISDKIICLVTYFIAHFSSELLYGLFAESVYKSFNISIGEKEQILALFFVNCIITLSLSFLFTGILKIYKKRKSKVMNEKILAYFTLLPVSHISFFVTLLALPQGTSESKDYSGLKLTTGDCVGIAILIFVFLFDVSYPFVLEHFQKIIEKNQQYEVELTKNKLNYEQTVMLKEEKQEFRKLKHDYSNIIATAKAFIEIGKIDKAIQILSKTEDNIQSISGFNICSDETINTVLYIKSKEAEKIGVKLNCSVDENYAVLTDEYDLCRILSNLLDNAIYASSATAEKNVSFKITVNKNELTIECSNSFVSNDKRKEKRNGDHGNGTGIIKGIVVKYAGNYSVSTTDGKWHGIVRMNNINKAQN